MLLEQRRHQVTERVRAKVRRDVSQADPLVAVPRARPRGGFRWRTLVVDPRPGTAELIFRRIRDGEEHERLGSAAARTYVGDYPLGLFCVRSPVAAVHSR